MVVHLNNTAKFTIAFWRGDELLDARTARNGELACKVAQLMLSEMFSVEDGDKLTVTWG